MATYGEKLKKIRQALNLTQDGLALELDMKTRAYAAYERDENKPPLFMLDILCNKYNVNLNWLVSNKGAMFNQEEFKEEDMNIWFRNMLDKELERRGIK